jgi:hypothetical protein
MEHNQKVESLNRLFKTVERGRKRDQSLLSLLKKEADVDGLNKNHGEKEQLTQLLIGGGISLHR